MTLVDDLQQRLQKALEGLTFLEALAPTLHPQTALYTKEMTTALAYPLKAGGKRIRPLLTLLMAMSCAGKQGSDQALCAALAVELVHTYTLVHDDLPCMDDDDLRRGQPTAHKVFGEAKALLIGDGLLAQAFLLLAKTDFKQHPKALCYALESLARASGPQGVIWGQWLDVSYTDKGSSADLCWEQVATIHTYKTGALLAASLELGLLCGLCTYDTPLAQSFEPWRPTIRTIGNLVGLAFQIQDDLLDATKTAADLGKTAGKDQAQNKATALSLLGADLAAEKSAQYTAQALALLQDVLCAKESLRKKCETTKNDLAEPEISVAEALLIQTIKDLLTRSN